MVPSGVECAWSEQHLFALAARLFPHDVTPLALRSIRATRSMMPLKHRLRPPGSHSMHSGDLAGFYSIRALL